MSSSSNGLQPTNVSISNNKKKNQNSIQNKLVTAYRKWQGSNVLSAFGSIYMTVIFIIGNLLLLFAIIKLFEIILGNI